MKSTLSAGLAAGAAGAIGAAGGTTVGAVLAPAGARDGAGTGRVLTVLPPDVTGVLITPAEPELGVFMPGGATRNTSPTSI